MIFNTTCLYEFSPSKTSETQIKLNLHSARRSLTFLQRKYKSLQIQLENTKAKLIKNKILIAKAMKNAFISLAEVKYVAGDVGKFILENVNTARIKILTKKENVSGINLHSFQCYSEGSDSNEYLCLAKGGQQVAQVKDNFREVIELLVELSSAQNNFITLNEVTKNLSRHVNALKHRLIPCLDRALLYIVSELDEYDREEFYRIKKMQNKKGSFYKISSLINTTENINSILQDSNKD